MTQGQVESPEIRLQRGLHLEEQKMIQVWLDAHKQRDRDRVAMLQRLTPVGLRNSGNHLIEEMNLTFDSMRLSLEKAIGVRKEISVHVPEMLSTATLDDLAIRLSRYVDGASNAAMSPPEMDITGPVRIAFSGRVQQRTEELRSFVARQILALKTEAQLGIPQSKNFQMTTYNISNNANVNLGTVIGDMNGSIQRLNEGGQLQLAEALKKLTEAIISSTELETAKQKELLEHLELVSDEAAKPVEKRKMSLLKTSIETIKGMLLAGSQALALWQGVEHELKIHGINLPT
jgi:hypothetical protein